MATQLLTAGTTAASSSDLTVAAGTPVTVALNDSDSSLSLNVSVVIELKDPAAAYFEVGRLTAGCPSTVISGPGTYRFTRIAGGSCGVFSA